MPIKAAQYYNREIILKIATTLLHAYDLKSHQFQNITEPYLFEFGAYFIDTLAGCLHAFDNHAITLQIFNDTQRNATAFLETSQGRPRGNAPFESEKMLTKIDELYATISNTETLQQYINEIIRIVNTALAQNPSVCLLVSKVISHFAPDQRQHLEQLQQQVERKESDVEQLKLQLLEELDNLDTSITKARKLKTLIPAYILPTGSDSRTALTPQRETAFYVLQHLLDTGYITTQAQKLEYTKPYRECTAEDQVNAITNKIIDETIGLTIQDLHPSFWQEFDEVIYSALQVYFTAHSKYMGQNSPPNTDLVKQAKEDCDHNYELMLDSLMKLALERENLDALRQKNAKLIENMQNKSSEQEVIQHLRDLGTTFSNCEAQITQLDKQYTFCKECFSDLSLVFSDYPKEYSNVFSELFKALNILLLTHKTHVNAFDEHCKEMAKHLDEQIFNEWGGGCWRVILGDKKQLSEKKKEITEKCGELESVYSNFKIEVNKIYQQMQDLEENYKQIYQKFSQQPNSESSLALCIAQKFIPMKHQELNYQLHFVQRQHQIANTLLQRTVEIKGFVEWGLEKEARNDNGFSGLNEGYNTRKLTVASNQPPGKEEVEDTLLYKEEGKGHSRHHKEEGKGHSRHHST